MASLTLLFRNLAGTLDGELAIEQAGRAALLSAAQSAENSEELPLEETIVQTMKQTNAHPVCRIILDTPLPWAPPTTSQDLAYIEVGRTKAHVELIGPGGLVNRDNIRMGLYGMIPNGDYGIRTHPAEEVFVMLAGQADWKRGDDGYQTLGVGKRSHHPTMLPHATRTTDNAFMSIYIWTGDVSTENYVYSGFPGKGLNS